MSTYDLEEQEQLAALKAWWKDHGGAIILGTTLALAGIGAWIGWTRYERSQAAQAAVLYDTLQKAARANDLKTTQEIAGAILENFPRDRKSTRLNSSHSQISYAVFCLKKKKKEKRQPPPLPKPPRATR